MEGVDGIDRVVEILGGTRPLYANSEVQYKYLV